jgi:hypothetical protein
MAVKKNPGPGRPLKIKTVQELQEKWQEFLEYCQNNNRPLTIGRLCVFLDIDSDTFNNYQDDRLEFFGTIKKMRQYILADKEERLQMAGNNATGIIFDLKNNHKWTDRHEIEQKTTLINVKDEELQDDIAQELANIEE